MKHKWHKEIKAWADGAEIESRYIGKTDLKQLKEWSDACDMDWDCSQTEFRIKPQPKEPQYLYVYLDDDNRCAFTTETFNEKDIAWEYIGKIKMEIEE